MSLRNMIGSVNPPHMDINKKQQKDNITNRTTMNRTFNRVIEIGDRKISVVSQIEKSDLQMAQTNSTLYFTLTKNLKRLNTEAERSQPSYKLFSYSPGSEYFSQSPQARRVIEKNKQFIRHQSPKGKNLKRLGLEVKVITAVKWERGQVKSARSQRYVEFNRDLLEAENFFPRVMSPELLQKPSSPTLKVHKRELSAISGAGGRAAVENLIQKLVKHFRIYQVRKEELMNDQNYSRGSLGDRTDYHSQQMDLRNFIYSLWDPAFVDYLQNLILDGVHVRIEPIKNFFKGRNINEIKYSAFRVQTEKFLKAELGENDFVQYTVKRIDDYRNQFIGEGWFEVFGGERSLKKLLQEVANQQVQDSLLQHFFAFGQKNTINAQEHYLTHLFQPLLKSILNCSIIQPKNDIPQQHNQLTITYIEFFRFKLHFQLALRKQKQSNLCMNMFAQILEKYRYTLIQPEPLIFKISQDQEV